MCCLGKTNYAQSVADDYYEVVIQFSMKTGPPPTMPFQNEDHSYFNSRNVAFILYFVQICIHPKLSTWGWFYLIGKVVSLAESVHDQGKGSPCIHNPPLLILHNLNSVIVRCDRVQLRPGEGSQEEGDPPQTPQ